MQADLEIRVLGEADAAAWWDLRREGLEDNAFAFGTALEEHLETTVESAAARLRDASADHFTLGAFEHERLAGTARFERSIGIKERHKGYVYGVYVTPSSRRHGIGRALLSAILDRCKRDPSIEQLHLAVSSMPGSAQSLYRSLGFERYGTEPHALKIGGVYVDEDLMILRPGSHHAKHGDPS